MLSEILAGQVSPTGIAALIIALVLGISVHEFAHAATATWLGDPTPRHQGRVTLSPVAHLDLLGSLMFVVAGFGWGKPVQYIPHMLRAGPRTGPALVSAAGPIANLILAALFAIPTRLMPIAFHTSALALYSSSSSEGILFELLFGIVFYNLTLSIFNLIPVFPLDGFTILLGLLPPELAERFEITKQYGLFILLLLLFVGGSLFNQIVYRPVTVLLRLLVGI